MKNLSTFRRVFTTLSKIGFCLFLTFCEVFAQVGPANASISKPSGFLEGKKPEANWIWDSGEGQPANYYLMFRKTVILDQVPENASAFISAYSYADIYINGNLLDRCPVNCDPEYQVYEQFDLSGYLQQGENVIAALVYNFGVGTHHRINARGGFFFQGKIRLAGDSILRINSDHNWKVLKAESWDNQSELRAAETHLIGFIEKYDARKSPGPWKLNKFDDSGWEDARELGIPPFAPWNKIVEVKRPLLSREVVYPVRHWFAGNKIVYDFGKEVTATPLIELYAKEEGARFEMETSERLSPDSTVLLYKERMNYTDYYTCKKGFQSWQPLTWRGFRYLMLTSGDSIIFKNISAVNRHYNYSSEGSFECSDPLLNQIYRTGVFTLQLCAQDTYMDTPWREQTQYIAGDTRYLQKYAYYPFGLSSEFLIHYNILSGAWSQRWSREGAIRSRYPTDYLLGPNTSTYLPDYELEYVIMLGEYYTYFGNQDLIKQVYPNMKKLLSYFEKFVGHDHGLLSGLPGWIVLDHPDTYPMDQKEAITGVNCLYHGALRQAALIAGIIGDTRQASVWDEQAEALKANIRKYLWSEEKKLFIDSYGSEKSSQQTQVYALLYGLVPPADKAVLIEKISSMGRNSEQSFSYYLLYTMFEEKPQWSLDYIREYWGAQMNLPLFNGAWHEAWEIEKWPGEIATTSHAWCSGPTALLPQKVLGVEPVSKGWERFSVKPNPCDLEWAKGIVPTKYGKIVVDWKIDKENNFSLYVLVPGQTKAEITVPVGDPGKITVNENPVFNYRIENGKVIFNVVPGQYRIKCFR